MKTHENVKNKITGNTTLAEIFNIPGTEEILRKYNLPCLHCPMSVYEMGMLKLKDVAKTYGIDIKSLLKELNKIAKK